MAFQVNFYNFIKQENSTARPSAAASSYNCNVLRGSGLINPTIELDMGLTAAPEWNYAYIPSWNRYYYINEWTFSGALWIASMTVDVLATYKSQIGSERLYALRASVSYDGTIIDTLYPAKVGCAVSRTEIENPFTSLENGTFIVGVVSNTPEFGSLAYYALTSEGMNKLISALLNDDLFTGAGFTANDASIALQKSLIDPLQYIKNAVYIPIRFGLIIGVPTNTVNVFDYALGMGDLASAKRLLKQSAVYKWIAGSVAIPKHPQTGARGNFVNCAPFTIAQLVFPPFGVINIDTTITANADHIGYELSIDEPTGSGILTLKANGMILNRLETQIGVPVQLSQITRDYIGASLAAVDAATGIASGIGSALSGNVIGGVAGAVGAGAHAAASATAALTPRSQTIGSGGSYAQLTIGGAALEMQFFSIVDDDINKNGRPLCRVVRPSEVGGYMLIQDGDVPINGTREEAQRIKAALESGFYYE